MSFRKGTVEQVLHPAKFGIMQKPKDKVFEAQSNIVKSSMSGMSCNCKGLSESKYGFLSYVADTFKRAFKTRSVLDKAPVTQNQWGGVVR